MNITDIKNNIRSNDHVELARRGETRKVKLTLKHLNKLRKLRELKSLERINMQKQLEIIYSTPEEAPPI